MEVTLVGVQKKGSKPINPGAYRQKRIRCFFERGKLFYAEYNLRLFFYLLFKQMDGLVAIDLDTALPCRSIAFIKRIKSVYDAHELFCEMKEVVNRPRVYRFWKWVERKTVPHFDLIYTVNQPIADELANLYQKQVHVIRNISVYTESKTETQKKPYVLYQGAVNEGRCFEQLIPAMKNIDFPLLICGDGNFMDKAKKLVSDHQLERKIIFKGMVSPDELRQITAQAKIGITLFEKDSKNNYYSLANRFFDYVHGYTPQICVNYPVYRAMNNIHQVAVMIEHTTPAEISDAINELLHNPSRWDLLFENCKSAAKDWTWQKEEQSLIQLYKRLFG